MAMTEKRSTAVGDLESMWRLPAREPARPKVLSGRATGLLVAGWLATLAVILVFEPDAEAAGSVPAWGQALGSGFLVAFVVTIFGLANRRPWATGGSLVAAGLGVMVGIACAATGHHAGAWPAVEAATFAALGAGTMIAARKSAR
jgi:hypothetical protein